MGAIHDVDIWDQQLVEEAEVLNCDCEVGRAGGKIVLSILKSSVTLSLHSCVNLRLFNVCASQYPYLCSLYITRVLWGLNEL